MLRLVAQELTNREIGEQHQSSEKTVLNHLTHIYRKAGISDQAEAVTFALRHGPTTGT